MRASVNPPLVIFGNPPPRVAGVLGDVKAVVYRHAESREMMVHGFGPHGERIELEDLNDGIAIHRLPRGVTRAQAIALSDGSILLRNRDGKPLWKRF